MESIISALDEAENTKGKPTVIIANTTKGKGSVLFEDKVQFHGVTPTKEEFDQAVKEINNG
jgi:transketolase